MLRRAGVGHGIKESPALFCLSSWNDKLELIGPGSICSSLTVAAADAYVRALRSSARS